jgi:hypothetical protein
VLSPAFPVMSNLLNASTSRDALPMCAAFDFGMVASLFECSMVSNVFAKGFGGACDGLLSLSSDDVSDRAFSNGSSSCWLGVEILSYVESSPPTIVEGVSRLEGDGG